jgi:hypothetical protein
MAAGALLDRVWCNGWPGAPGVSWPAALLQLVVPHLPLLGLVLHTQAGASTDVLRGGLGPPTLSAVLATGRSSCWCGWCARHMAPPSVSKPPSRAPCG